MHNIPHPPGWVDAAAPAASLFIWVIKTFLNYAFSHIAEDAARVHQPYLFLST